MESQLVWKEEYNIGVDIIDKEHKRLFKIINKFSRLRKKKRRVSGHARRESNSLKIMH